MTHTVCGQPVQFVAVPVEGFPPMGKMCPYCTTCSRFATDDELAPDRVSPGRPWELDPDEG